MQYAGGGVNNGKYVRRDNAGNISYVDRANATAFVTDNAGQILIDNILTGDYIIEETETIEGYKLLEGTVRATVGRKVTATVGITDKVIKNRAIGPLKIVKVDKYDETKKLSDIKFVIQYNEEGENNGKYVRRDNAGNITYVERANATEFVTGEDKDKPGEILIENLLTGKYSIYETETLYDYKLLEETVETEVERKLPGKAEPLKPTVIGNERKLIKLSGYVWEDKVVEIGKESIKNDLYKDNAYDVNDKLLEGITVRLKEKQENKIVRNFSNVECITTTNEKGEYEFKDILIDELANYYVEFEYDGIKYKNVEPNINKDNGSKGAENQSEREKFNEGFAIIEGTGENKAEAKDENGKDVKTLEFERNEEEHIATWKDEGEFIITGNTRRSKM